jgi:urease accessory protein
MVMGMATDITMTEALHALALVRLLQLVSPALPVGAYAYSQGLEQAVQVGWIQDEAGARDWVAGLLEHNLGQLDVPLLLRLHRAWSHADQDQVDYWCRYLCAARETAELRSEDRQTGTALARLLVDLDCAAARAWVSHPDVNWPAMFALAAVHWQVPAETAALGYLWAWCENQVAAAIKLVPLGQTAGQRILVDCAARIPAIASAAAGCEDEDIGQLAAALVMASAWHETQYSRLFRS